MLYRQEIATHLKQMTELKQQIEATKLKLEEAQTNYAFAIAANRLHEVPKFRGLVRKYTKQIRNLVILRCDLGEV